MPNPMIELAGKYALTELTADGGFSMTFSDKPPTGRVCGDCQLCCKLVPVLELHKAAGERCRHQKTGKGCTVYRRRGFPDSCGYWSCRWLTDPKTAGMPRPDRCHYVVDVMVDEVTMTSSDGVTSAIPVMQVWVDPAFPDVHQAPELRALMASLAEEHRLGTLVRWNAKWAMLVLPPAISPTGDWFERADTTKPETALDHATMADHEAFQRRKRRPL